MNVPRVPSGIPGFDAVIQGGIPSNSTIALRANPSNVTEYFQQQFIIEGLKGGFPGVYCCLARPPSNVIRSLRQQGFDPLEQIANDQLVLIDFYSLLARASAVGVDQAVQRKIISVTQVDDERMLQEGLASAVERISNLRGLRAVCENMTGVLTNKEAIEIMRWGRKAFADLRVFETVTLHTFPVGNREDLFSLMANDFDSILEIQSEVTGGKTHYTLNVQKMRLTEIPTAPLALETEGALLSLKTEQRIS